jgi:YVTN family beta-propeller protein
VKRAGQSYPRIAALVCAAAGSLGLIAAWHPGRVRPSIATGRTGEVLIYASPIEMLFSPDGARLYVLCQGADEVRVLDAQTFVPIKNVPVGHIPRGFSLSHDGRRLLVANTWDDTISVIDIASLSVTATWPVGAEPSSVVEDREGKHVFVANRVSNDIAVLDAQTGTEEKRLAAGRGAS